MSLSKNPGADTSRLAKSVLRCVLFSVILVLQIGTQAFAQQSPNQFKEFVSKQGSELRKDDKPPRTIEEWNLRRVKLRENLLKAWGGFPAMDCDLEPRILGQYQREGYRVEKLVFQTRPGIWMPANAYVPDRPGKLPAILHVHGHWAGAKQDPIVQSRCIGCAKLGFFVLCVDAFGAGERGVGKKLGEYHGEMTAATLYPIGLPLSGLQAYENQRAVDYLRTRPEVDPDHIGITGASGGGNQTMYAGAIDERLKCVVPTCSVGTYQAYLTTACCQCEVVPEAFRFTEEGDVLGLAANRGLMVISATKDAFQFSVGEAKKSLQRVEAIASLYPGADIKHTIIESPHAYNQPMREAMYGWMTKHLKNIGDGSPIADPSIETEDPELLRCFPADSRPDEYITIPRFAAIEADRLAANRAIDYDRPRWENARPEKRRALIEVLGGLPKAARVALTSKPDTDDKSQTLTFETEPGLTMFARRDLPERPGRLAIVLDLDRGAEYGWSSELADHLREGEWKIVTPELRATGSFALAGDKIGHAPDHHTAEWSIWLGRPLLGQWVHDIRRTLDAIAERDGSLPHDVMVIGQGPSGIVALCAAALDERITRVTAIDSMASYATDEPYRGQRLGLMVPGILRDFGDIADIAALVAPRAVTIKGGTNGAGAALNRDALMAKYQTAKRAFELFDVPNLLVIEER